MKHSIASRLALGFLVLLVLFALAVGVLFTALLSSHTLRAKKEEMSAQAAAIAASLAAPSTEQNADTTPRGRGAGRGQGSPGGPWGGGTGATLRLLDAVTAGNAWVVDENLQLITGGQGQRTYQYTDLPPAAEQLVKEAFEGKEAFSEGFSDLLQTPTLTLARPLYAGEQVTGALLLHAPVAGLRNASTQGLLLLLYAMGAALVLSLLLGALLARWMVRPLSSMRDTALQLAGGDYAARTGILRADEIGQLAASMDILGQRLQEAKERDTQLEQMRRDFVANISHELRTPVTVIRGSLEALHDGVVKAPRQVAEYHGQMLLEIQGLERLVNDLLDLSRLQSADFQMEMEELNLCEVISDAVRSARQLALKKGVEIITDLDCGLLRCRGDYSRLRQMLLIVLQNAVKFSPANGQVGIRLKEGSLQVYDQGPGIQPDDLPHIFDRFYKARTQQNQEGSGLGLAIAGQIARRHGIALSAGNQPGGGACFTFRLP
ncbi:MAG: HAMP domain-containing histidine kinase [Clostridiales bacterium]|nr:HAMP domain-containing histidine kinase [Clostridiales bacterium]